MEESQQMRRISELLMDYHNAGTFNEKDLISEIEKQVDVYYVKEQISQPWADNDEDNIIAVNGGYVNIVNTIIEHVGNKVKVDIYARMSYGIPDARKELAKKLLDAGFEKTLPHQTNEDTKLKTIWINPFKK